MWPHAPAHTVKCKNTVVAEAGQFPPSVILATSYFLFSQIVNLFGSKKGFYLNELTFSNTTTANSNLYYVS